MRVVCGLLLPVLPAVLLSGCRVESHDNGAGREDVKVATPFGHMQVNTNKDQVQDSVGLTVYPGATPDQRDHGDNKSADINMSFGSFKLRVKAVGYTTPDPMDRVEDFYRKDLARYGTVIACDGHHALGSPTRTPEGLTCDDDDDHVHADTTGSVELKTGSKQHQHLVALKRNGDTTKIGLVALDLPGDHFGDSDSEKNAQ